MKTEQQQKVAVAFSNFYKVWDRLEEAQGLITGSLTTIGVEDKGVAEAIGLALLRMRDLEGEMQRAEAVADGLADMKANSL